MTGSLLLRVALAVGAMLMPLETMAAPLLHRAVWRFTGKPDGEQPSSEVTADSSGHLFLLTSFGGAYNNGAVIMLTPPVGSQATWTEQVIYSFDYNSLAGYDPSGNIFVDPTGVIYGTTSQRANGFYGTVWQLIPPQSGGAWTLQVLGNLAGAIPGGVVQDASRSLYGCDAAEVYRLNPPQGVGAPWSKTVLHTFLGSPTDGAGACELTLDQSGNLLGTSSNGGPYPYGGGVAFELIHPQVSGREWRENILWYFGGPNDGSFPSGGLTHGPDGALYGVLYGGLTLGTPQINGSIYRLTPPALGQALWQEQLIASPDMGVGAEGPVAFDDLGAAYAVTRFTAAGYSYSWVFKATPPASGQTNWTEQTVLQFTDRSGWEPLTGLVRVRGRMFGTTVRGGSHDHGTVYDFAPATYAARPPAKSSPR